MCARYLFTVNKYVSRYNSDVIPLSRRCSRQPETAVCRAIWCGARWRAVLPATDTAPISCCSTSPGQRRRRRRRQVKLAAATRCALTPRRTSDRTTRKWRRSSAELLADLQCQWHQGLCIRRGPTFDPRNVALEAVRSVGAGCGGDRCGCQSRLYNGLHICRRFKLMNKLLEIPHLACFFQSVF